MNRDPYRTSSKLQGPASASGRGGYSVGGGRGVSAEGRSDSLSMTTSPTPQRAGGANRDAPTTPAMLAASYTRLSRDQLLQVVLSRDEEISSLRTMNREASQRLQQVEQRLVDFECRIDQMDDAEDSLQKKVAGLEAQLHQAERRLQETSASRAELESRSVDLEKALEHELLWRRGYFPSLGLAVQNTVSRDTKHSATQLQTVAVRDPAKQRGAEVGDILISASFTTHRLLNSVADYQRLVGDVPPDATVNLEVLRENKRLSVQIQPLMLPYHGTPTR